MARVERARSPTLTSTTAAPAQHLSTSVLSNTTTSTTTADTSNTTRTGEPFPLITLYQYRLLSRILDGLPKPASTWAEFTIEYDKIIEEETNGDRELELKIEAEIYPICLKLSLEKGKDWSQKWGNVIKGLKERGVDYGGRGGGRKEIDHEREQRHSSSEDADEQDLRRINRKQMRTPPPIPSSQSTSHLQRTPTTSYARGAFTSPRKEAVLLTSLANLTSFERLKARVEEINALRSLDDAPLQSTVRTLDVARRSRAQPNTGPPAFNQHQKADSHGTFDLKRRFLQSGTDTETAKEDERLSYELPVQNRSTTPIRSTPPPPSYNIAREQDSPIFHSSPPLFRQQLPTRDFLIKPSTSQHLGQYRMGLEQLKDPMSSSSDAIHSSADELIHRGSIPSRRRFSSSRARLQGAQVNRRVSPRGDNQLSQPITPPSNVVGRGVKETWNQVTPHSPSTSAPVKATLSSLPVSRIPILVGGDKAVTKPMERPPKTMSASNSLTRLPNLTTNRKHNDPMGKNDDEDKRDLYQDQKTISELIFLESQSSSFRQFSLLSMSWYEWRIHLSQLGEREHHLDGARERLLKIWVMGIWSRKMTLSYELHKKADLFRKNKERSKITMGDREIFRFKEAIFTSWLSHVNQRKARREWEKHLRSAWEVVRRKWKLSSKQRVFIVWRTRLMNKRADDFYTSLLLHRAFSTWDGRLLHIRSLAAKSLEIVHSTEVKTRQYVLSEWYRKAALRVNENGWIQSRDDVLKENVWLLWKERSESSLNRREWVATACQFEGLNQAKRSWQKWRFKLNRVHSLNTSCSEFRQKTEISLQKTCLTFWMNNYSGSVLFKARQNALLRSFLQRWASKYVRIAVEWDNWAFEFKEDASNVVAQTCLEQWVEAHQKKIKSLLQAEQIDTIAIKRRSLKMLMEAMSRRKIDSVKADVARDFFLQRRMWNMWMSSIAKLKQRRWIAAKLRKDKAKVLNHWLNATRMAISNEVLVQTFQQATNTRVLENSLIKWTRRVVDVRALEMQVTAEYESRLTRLAFDAWADKCLQHGEDYSLVESFVDIKIEDLLRKSFRLWLKSSRKQIDLRDKLELFTEERKRRVIERTYSLWRDAHVRPLERAFVQRRQVALLRNATNRWTRKTTLIPAIRFHETRTKQKHLLKWKQGTPDPEKLRQAREFDQIAATEKCFEVWKIKYQARAAIRSIHKFKSFTSTRRQKDSTKLPVPTPPSPRSPSPSMARLGTPSSTNRHRPIAMPTLSTIEREGKHLPKVSPTPTSSLLISTPPPPPLTPLSRSIRRPLYPSPSASLSQSLSNLSLSSGGRRSRTLTTPPSEVSSLPLQTFPLFGHHQKNMMTETSVDSRNSSAQKNYTKFGGGIGANLERETDEKGGGGERGRRDSSSKGSQLEGRGGGGEASTSTSSDPSSGRRARLKAAATAAVDGFGVKKV